MSEQPSIEVSGRDEMQSLATRRRKLISELRDVESKIVSMVRTTLREDDIVALTGIISKVAEAFKVSAADIIGRRRPGYINLARHAFCYLARSKTDNSLAAIGRYMLRDHGSVMNGERKARDLIDTCPSYARTIKEIEEAL